MTNDKENHMKEKKYIDVEFCKVGNDAAAFVEVAYTGKNKRSYRGLMMLDTGSNINVVFGKMAEDVELVLNPENEKVNEEVVGIRGTMEQMTQVCFPFTMGGDCFNEPFVLMNQRMDEMVVGELPVLGVLGNMFLQRYKLVVDYAEHSLHTSTIVPKYFAIEECEYFYPMYLGLKYYGVPVVFVKKKEGDGDVVTLIDTGSADNMTSHVAVERYGLPYSMGDETFDLTGTGSSVTARKGKVEFCVMSFASETQSSMNTYNDDFMVVEQPVLLKIEGKDEDGDDLPPVEMLLGSVFLGREGWVLDFGVQAMYKRRAA